MYSKMRERKIFRISNFCIAFLIAFSFILPPEAFAARRRAGGGELAHFDFGNYAAGIGIGVGAMAVGGVINAGLSSALGNVTSVGKGVLTGSAIPSITQQSSNILTAMGNSLSYSFTTTGLITNMSTFMAVSQVGRAVGAMGSYYGWKPSTTFLASSFASGLVGGFMNPTVALGPSISENISSSIIPGVHYTLNPANYTLGNMLNGAFVGGVTGLASGAVIVAIDGNKINKGKQPGVGAQIAGMVTGVAVGNLTRELMDPTLLKPTKKTLDVVRQIENPEIKTFQEQARVSQAKAGESFGKAAEPLTHALSKAGEAGGDLIKGDYSGALGHAKAMGEKMSWEDVKSAAGNIWDGLGSLSDAQTQIQQAKAAEPYNYQKVTAKNVWTGRETLSRPYSPAELRGTYPSDANITTRPIKNASEYYQVVQLNPQATASDVLGRLFNATFIKTIDTWPKILVSSLSIAAVNSLGKKDRWLAPLVNAGIEGIAGPFIYRAQEYFPLKLSYLVGENHLAQSVAYVEGMRQAARNDYLNAFSKEARQIYDKPNLSNAELRGELQGLIDPRFNQREQLEYRMKQSGIDPTKLTAEEWKDKADDVKIKLPSIENYETKVAQRTEEAKNLRIKTGLPQEMPDARKLMLADTLGVGKTQITFSINVADTNLGEVYKVTGTSPASLYFNSALRDMRFGFIDALISGSIASLANKVSEKNPLAAAGVGYGAAMLSGAIRGAVLHATWEPSRDKNNELIWMDRYEVVKPNKPEKQVDWLHQGVAEETFKQQLKEYNEFGQRTGIVPTALTRELKSGTETDILHRLWIANNDLEFKKGAWKLKDGLAFPRPENEIKPDLKTHILFGLNMASDEFLYKAFSFGAPLASPENIDAMQMASYMRTLNSFAQTAMSADLRYIPSTRRPDNKNISFRQSMESCKERLGAIKKLLGGHPKKAIDQFYSKRPREDQPLTGWLTPGIVSGYVNASSSVIGNNILGSMAQMPFTANLFNMQRQRLVLTTSPRVPLALQSKDYQPWVNVNETKILLSPHIPRSTTPLPSSGEYFGKKSVEIETKIQKSAKDIEKEIEANNNKLKMDAEEAELRRKLEEAEQRRQSEEIKDEKNKIKRGNLANIIVSAEPEKEIFLNPKQFMFLKDPGYLLGPSQPAPKSETQPSVVDDSKIFYSKDNILLESTGEDNTYSQPSTVQTESPSSPLIKIIDSQTGEELDPEKTKILWNQYYKDKLKDRELTWDTWLGLESNPLIRGNEELKQAMQDALVGNWVEKNKQDAFDYIADKLNDNRVVILGEEHRTIAHRKFLEQFISNYGGERVNYLVVEFGRELQPLFDQYMQDGKIEALKKGLEASNWGQDLPNWLPVFQAAKANEVKIVAAEPSTRDMPTLERRYLSGEQTSTGRDLSIAQKVFEIREKDPQAKILIHYGGYHANKLPNDYGQPSTIRLEPAQDRNINQGGPIDKDYVGRSHSLANLLANNTPENLGLNPTTLLLGTFVGQNQSLHKYQLDDVGGTRPVVVPISKDNPLSLPEKTPAGLTGNHSFDRNTYNRPLSGYDGMILFPGHQKLYNDIFGQETKRNKQN